MKRLFANLWGILGVSILMFIGFFCLVGVLCITWYNHSLKESKKDAQEVKELLRQSKEDKDITKSIQHDSSVSHSAKNNVINRENNKINQNEDVKNAEIHTDNHNENITVIPEKSKHDQKIIESPFGFGRYPSIPPGFPLGVSWQSPNHFFTVPEEIKYQGELVDRVLIKLFNEGDREFIAGKWHKGKVYPVYPNTFYVEINEKQIEGIDITAQTIRIIGPGGTRDIQKRLEKALAIGKTIPGIKVLAINKYGIDPYDYLQIK